MRATISASAVLLLGLASGRAAAGVPRVVLLGIGASDAAAAGDAPRAAENAVREMLSTHFQLLAGAAYKAKAKELGATGASPAEVKSVCAAIGATAIVAGMLSSEEDTWELRLVLRRCDTGAVVAKFHYPLVGPEVDYNSLKRAESDLSSAIDSLGAGSSPPSSIAATTPEAGTTVAPPPPEGESSSAPSDIASENPLEAEAASGANEVPPSESEAPPGESSAAGETTGETISARATHPGQPWIDAALGLSAGSRSFTFANPTRQRFVGGAIRGIYYDATVLPLEGRTAHRALAGLGVGATVDYVPDYTTNLGSASGAPLSTFEESWALELRERFALGDEPLAPELRLAAGYGSREFVIHDQPGVAVPSLAYSFLTLRAGGFLPLLRGRAALFADLAILPSLGIDLGSGPSAFGNASGGLGWQVDGGADVTVTRHVHLRALLGYTYLPSHFSSFGDATETHLDGELLAAVLF